MKILNLKKSISPTDFVDFFGAETLVYIAIMKLIHKISDKRLLSYLLSVKSDGYIHINQVIKNFTPPDDSQPIFRDEHFNRLIRLKYVRPLPTKRCSKKIMITQKGIDRLEELKNIEIPKSYEEQRGNVH
jgi:hypothetical protein